MREIGLQLPDRYPCGSNRPEKSEGPDPSSWCRSLHLEPQMSCYLRPNHRRLSPFPDPPQEEATLPNLSTSPNTEEHLQRSDGHSVEMPNTALGPSTDPP